MEICELLILVSKTILMMITMACMPVKIWYFPVFFFFCGSFWAPGSGSRFLIRIRIRTHWPERPDPIRIRIRNFGFTQWFVDFRRGAGRAYQFDNEELSVQPAGLGGEAAQDGRLLQAHGGRQRAQPGGVQVRLGGGGPDFSVFHPYLLFFVTKDATDLE